MSNSGKEGYQIIDFQSALLFHIPIPVSPKTPGYTRYRPKRRNAKYCTAESKTPPPERDGNAVSCENREYNALFIAHVALRCLFLLRRLDPALLVHVAAEVVVDTVLDATVVIWALAAVLVSVGLVVAMLPEITAEFEFMKGWTAGSGADADEVASAAVWVDDEAASVVGWPEAGMAAAATAVVVVLVTVAVVLGWVWEVLGCACWVLGSVLITISVVVTVTVSVSTRLAVTVTVTKSGAAFELVCKGVEDTVVVGLAGTPGVVVSCSDAVGLTIMAVDSSVSIAL
jgi:hypothetical protein